MAKLSVAEGATSSCLFIEFLSPRPFFFRQRSKVTGGGKKGGREKK